MRVEMDGDDIRVWASVDELEGLAAAFLEAITEGEAYGSLSGRAIMIEVEGE